MVNLAQRLSFCDTSGAPPDDDGMETGMYIYLYVLLSLCFCSAVFTYPLPCAIHILRRRNILPNNNNGQAAPVYQPGSNASTSFPAAEHATTLPPESTLVGYPHAVALLSEVAIGEISAPGMLEATKNPAGDRLPEAVPWAIPMEENSEHSDQQVSSEFQGNNNAFPL